MDGSVVAFWKRCRWIPVLFLPSFLCGCQSFLNAISSHLTNWQMLDQKALEDPIKAMGGDGIVFVPKQDSAPLNRRQLAAAKPETLVDYYSPIFVQQRVNTQAQAHPYPPEYDMIGEAHLRREANGKLKSYVAGQPKVYAIVKLVAIEGHDHIQITYTAWYPAHPRMKTIDLEEADIDSCVVRVTLDADHAPLFYETIAACGCFHKVFVERRIEDGARELFGQPEKEKKFCVERSVRHGIDWEVGGVVDDPKDQPRRPVVFLKAGEHKVIGMGSASRLRVPPTAEKHPYELTSYADLYSVEVDGSHEPAAFFDMSKGGKVHGAERKKEKFLLMFAGVDSAGQPRADDQIKMHFDQSTWGDPSIYAKYLRLPPGTL
jgi:hypothetical protein